MNNAVLDRAGVKAKFDVFPEQIIDYLALVGDSSDNIPGIDKVGPKTAAKLLQQYGTLDGVMAHLGEIPGKVGENLRAGLSTLELSRRLATIRTDLELPLALEELAPGRPMWRRCASSTRAWSCGRCCDSWRALMRRPQPPRPARLQRRCRRVRRSQRSSITTRPSRRGRSWSGG